MKGLSKQMSLLHLFVLKIHILYNIFGISENSKLEHSFLNTIGTKSKYKITALSIVNKTKT